MLLAASQNSSTKALDHPAWAALSTKQMHLGVKAGNACAFERRVAPFAAINPDADLSSADLMSLACTRPEGLVLMQAGPLTCGPGIRVVETLTGVQMIGTDRQHRNRHAGTVQLSQEDIPAMLSLAAVTKQGPFKRRTLQTGAYFGIKVAGQLVAMAGERMKLTGYTEISAVCTHPRFRGCGFAGALVCHVAELIRARQDTPFLHTCATNKTAIALYEPLGFELHREMHIVRLVFDR